MSQSHRNARRLACAVVAAFALGTASPAAAAAAECANADVMPTSDNLDEMREAVLCLTNAERKSRRLPSLRENSRLRKAAISHSADMIRNGFFSHTGSDGDTLVDRVVEAGYVRRFDGWALGENLAWGTGDLSTPRSIQAAWMKSSGHRANLLKPGHREIGIGIRLGVPQGDGGGATFTNDFGSKT